MVERGREAKGGGGGGRDVRCEEGVVSVIGGGGGNDSSSFRLPFAFGCLRGLGAGLGYRRGGSCEGGEVIPRDLHHRGRGGGARRLRGRCRFRVHGRGAQVALPAEEVGRLAGRGRRGVVVAFVVHVAVLRGGRGGCARTGVTSNGHWEHRRCLKLLENKERNAIGSPEISEPDVAFLRMPPAGGVHERAESASLWFQRKESRWGFAHKDTTPDGLHRGGTPLCKRYWRRPKERTATTTGREMKVVWEKRRERVGSRSFSCESAVPTRRQKVLDCCPAGAGPRWAGVAQRQGLPLRYGRVAARELRLVRPLGRYVSRGFTNRSSES
ncbi:hypothetical protein DFH08DRAFT_887175 [Mycena albidolilacea]|uniref:Uncharacterized protein n=1 Tax=Mycena albidolilacea TaxID=1033008 RepID=A0AAD6ZIQ3_9AGAR|nr:hypothetical protein DFH08DRAFT_887175 [Mycena albidolilacea]